MEKLFLLKVLILLSSIPSLIFATQIAKQNLCNHTPYPTICNSLITNSVKYLPSSKQTNIKFRDIALLITLQNAEQVHRQISSMDFSSLDKLSKIAWEDCLELYEDTINQLNQTISSSSYNSLTLDDIQTYLSASNTNHKTCQNGFLDLQVTSNLTLLTSNYMSKFSQLLSNVLSINGAILTSNNVVGGSNRRLLATKNPSWMSKGDRTLLESSMEAIKPDLVVAKDGSGNYKTISEAIAATKKLINGKNRFIIYIKGGIYKENIVVTNRMRNLMLIGDGIDVTIVSGNKNVQDGSTTFRSATFAISGDGFIAKGITFENTAGPQKHQAVALRSGSDYSIFYRCSFKGYQDTLYVYSKRQFYKECDIYGTVDFIFGNAAAIIQNCNIYVRKPMNNQQNTVTAQGRTDPNENTGIVIHNSIIEASSDLRPVQGSFRTFLGRPWQMYSRTIVMKCNIDRLIDHAGWAPWSGDFALKSLYYAEYMNSGAGSGTNGRVKWAGYHVITSPIEAGKFTVGKFLGGDNWIPATGVPFTSGL